MYKRICRPIETVLDRSETNTNGYNMHMLGVHMSATQGLSGAPLLSSSGEVLGMLHASFKDEHSYFAAGNHITDFLKRRKVPPPNLSYE